MEREERACQPAIRSLTKKEIDQRIEELIREVAVLRPEAADGSPRCTEPRWIAPAELVRRLRRFIVYN
jgi:hypothetical protein